MKYLSLAVIISAILGAGIYLLTRPEPIEVGLSPTQPTDSNPSKPTDPKVEEPPAKLSTEAEPLPELPKADPKSTLKQLLPNDKLYLETTPEGKMRILFPAEVCLREGVLEVLLCRTNTKEHEAILRSPIDARFLHAALLAIGAKPGSPVQFVNPQTQELEYKPASGAKVNVSVHYRKDGKLHTHQAQDWIQDQQTKKPMSYSWVFAGSRFMKNPDRLNDPDYYCANNGEIISISNFVDSMLEVPVEISRDNASLNFAAETSKIPPQLSKVWVILEPAEAPAGEKK